MKRPPNMMANRDRANQISHDLNTISASKPGGR